MARKPPVSTPSNDPDFFPLDPLVWERIAGDMRLSPQQKKIVELLLQGKKCKQLAPAMGLAAPTVTTYLKRIYQNLDVEDHTQLLLYIMALSQEPSRSPKGRRK